jgi:hypothetical protein
MTTSSGSEVKMLKWANWGRVDVCCSVGECGKERRILLFKEVAVDPTRKSEKE